MGSKSDASDKLYISIDEGLSKLSKMDILNSQADLIKIQKHVRNFQVLAKQKAEIKQRLAVKIKKLLADIEKLEALLPEVDFRVPKVPMPADYQQEKPKRGRKKKNEGKKVEKRKGKKDTQPKKRGRKKKNTHADLDEELKKIKEQLEKINTQ